MAQKEVQFGCRWDKSTPLLARHLLCAYHNGGNGAFFHRKEVIKIISPKFQWNRWADRMLQSFCDKRWNTWLGPASSSKTQTAAEIAYGFWLEAPDVTRVIVCSTTKDALRSRIWGQVARINQEIPESIGPGKLLDSSTRILYNSGDQINGIFGMAVEEGPVTEVINNLVGFKAERVLLILDEMQGIREAIMDATINMSANPWFGLIGMGNPSGLLNPLGRESEPIGGWDSVERGVTEQWDTLGGPVIGGGRCNFFDGRKSPADDSPEERKRLFFLINQDKREGMLKACRGNENDPRYWQMAIGWPPMMGLESTVLDESIIVKFKCREPAVWTSEPFKWASLDPSFEGKDKKMLSWGRCGETLHEGMKRWVIGIEGQEEITVSDAADAEPIHYQIVAFVKPFCQSKGIRPDFFGLDSSGEGGGLAAIFNREWGSVLEVEFGGKPSKMPIDALGKEAKEAYNSRSSELNFMVREFALGNGIRGLPDEAAKQFVSRKTFFKNGKWCVESKTARGSDKGFKQRLGYSPDNADSIAIAVDVCRHHGAYPSTDGSTAVEEMERPEPPFDEYREENYLIGYSL